MTEGVGMKTRLLTAARLREVLDYDRATGIFTWRVSPSPQVKAGDVAGHIAKNGYVQIGIDGAVQYAHRDET